MSYYDKWASTDMSISLIGSMHCVQELKHTHTQAIVYWNKLWAWPSKVHNLLSGSSDRSHYSAVLIVSVYPIPHNHCSDYRQCKMLQYADYIGIHTFANSSLQAIFPLTWFETGARSIMFSYGSSLREDLRSPMQVITPSLHVLSDWHVLSVPPDSSYPSSQLCIATVPSNLGLLSGR